MFLSHGTIFPSVSVPLVIYGKNFLVNESCQNCRHIWLQELELKSWLSAYCLSCWFKKRLLRSSQ